MSKIEPRAEPGVAKGSRYTEEEVERGLTAVALCSGNTRRAAKGLHAQGLDIPRSTLDLWQRELYRDRYVRIQQEVAPRIHAQIAQQCEDLARREAELAGKLIDQLERDLPALKPHEQAAALRSVEVAKAINVDKSLLLRGRPTQIVEQRDLTEILRSLAAHPGVTVHSPLLNSDSQAPGSRNGKPETVAALPERTS